MPVHSSLLIFSDSIQVHSRGDNALTLTVAKNLGSLFDEQLTMSTHINKLCGVAFYHLHDIKRIRKYLSRESTILLITFKAIHGLAPKYLRNLLTFKSSLYNLRSSGSILLSMPAVRSKTLGDRAFMVAAPRLWNSLPKELRAITNVNSFKAHIKTYLFRTLYW